MAICGQFQLLASLRGARGQYRGIAQWCLWGVTWDSWPPKKPHCTKTAAKPQTRGWGGAQPRGYRSSVASRELWSWDRLKDL